MEHHSPALRRRRRRSNRAHLVGGTASCHSGRAHRGVRFQRSWLHFWLAPAQRGSGSRCREPSGLALGCSGSACSRHGSEHSRPAGGRRAWRRKMRLGSAGVVGRRRSRARTPPDRTRPKGLHSLAGQKALDMGMTGARWVSCGCAGDHGAGADYAIEEALAGAGAGAGAGTRAVSRRNRQGQVRRTRLPTRPPRRRRQPATRRSLRFVATTIYRRRIHWMNLKWYRVFGGLVRFDVFCAQGRRDWRDGSARYWYLNGHGMGPAAQPPTDRGGRFRVGTYSGIGDAYIRHPSSLWTING